MPVQMKIHFHLFARELFHTSTAGADRKEVYIEHDMGKNQPKTLQCENVWSYQNLIIPLAGGLTLDFAALPEGIPGKTKDLATNQVLTVWCIDNHHDDTQITIQLLGPGLTPLPGVGYALGPGNQLVQLDDEGESLLSQFIAGMQFDVFMGDHDAAVELILGTVPAPSP